MVKTGSTILLNARVIAGSSAPTLALRSKIIRIETIRRILATKVFQKHLCYFMSGNFCSSSGVNSEHSSCCCRSFAAHCRGLS